MYQFNTILSIIQQKALACAAKINAPQEMLPTYGNAGAEYQPNIALGTNGQLRYEMYERGQLITNELAENEDDLLYRIFRDICFTMATSYEMQNRNPRQDSRRVLFARQRELLGQINEPWKERIAKEQQLTLKSNPFDDNSTRRMDYYNQLIKAGKTYEQAMSEANKKFPVRNH